MADSILKPLRLLRIIRIKRMRPDLPSRAKAFSRRVNLLMLGGGVGFFSKSLAYPIWGRKGLNGRAGG
ncbi:MAG: hypothetical protein ACLUMK_13500 [Christensenellales bacterium]